MALPYGLTPIGEIKGDKGDKGDVGTIATVTAEVVAADQPAEVIMTGPQTARHAHFKVPRGLPGFEALADDEVVATYIAALDTQTRSALFAAFTPVFASIETLEEVAVMASPTPQSYSSRPRFRRPMEDPIFRASDGSSASITWGNMVENPNHPDPNKRWWLLYFTDHATVHSTTGMRAATAPTPFGPFTDQGLIFRDDTGGSQHETGRIWRDERTDQYISLYSMQNSSATPVPGARGSQVSKWATSPDLETWTVQGIAADVEATDPGDGHTGYANGPVVIGGREHFYTLFGGTVRGLRAMWRRQPGNGFKLIRDHRVIGSQLNMLRGMDDVSVAGTGTPSTDSTATAAGNGAKTVDLYWRPTHSAFVAFRGRTWMIGPVAPKSPGGLVIDAAIVAAPMAESMVALAEPPARLDIGEPAYWETGTRFDNFGNTFTYQGRCFFVYRSGGHQGAFGIGEIY